MLASLTTEVLQNGLRMLHSFCATMAEQEASQSTQDVTRQKDRAGSKKPPDGARGAREGAFEFASPAQRWSGLAQSVIYPIDNEAHRKALQEAIASVIFQCKTWGEIRDVLQDVGDDPAALLSLQTYEALCHRIQSQGIPQPDAAGGYATFVRAEKTHFLKTKVKE